MIPPRLLEAETDRELVDLVRAIRAHTDGVPVGFKLGATQWLERELEILIRTKPDFIAIDGMEGGTHGGLGSSLDALGTPTLYALVRARRFLTAKN